MPNNNNSRFERYHRMACHATRTKFKRYAGISDHLIVERSYILLFTGIAKCNNFMIIESQRYLSSLCVNCYHKKHRCKVSEIRLPTLHCFLPRNLQRVEFLHYLLRAGSRTELGENRFQNGTGAGRPATAPCFLILLPKHIETFDKTVLQNTDKISDVKLDINGFLYFRKV
jgi:hypothetical protein